MSIPISALLLAAQVGCTPPADQLVVGFWESTNTKTSNGIGHALELKADGSFVSTMTVILDQFYRVSAKRLLRAESPAAFGPRTDAAPFAMKDGLLIIRQGAGGEVRMESLGQPDRPSDPPRGDWRYRHYTGGRAFERYTSDGRLLFRLPLSTDHGCYRAEAGALTLDWGNRPTPYQVSSDTLTRDPGEGRPGDYRRAEPWYPRDTIDYQPPKR